jgi:hypothetical protein
MQGSAIIAPLSVQCNPRGARFLCFLHDPLAFLPWDLLCDEAVNLYPRNKEIHSLPNPAWRHPVFDRHCLIFK